MYVYIMSDLTYYPFRLAACDLGRVLRDGKRIIKVIQLVIHSNSYGGRGVLVLSRLLWMQNE